MAGSLHKIMAYLGLVDDYDDYDDLSDRGRPAASRPAPPARPTRPADPREREREYQDDRYDQYEQRPPMGTVSRIRPMTADGTPSEGPGASAPMRPKVTPLAPSETARPYIVAPVRFSDAKEIGDHMRHSNPVIVNLQQADRDLQRRMIDFCSGIAYALACDMERVADQVFLLTPTNVTISPEERARLERRGFNSDD